MKHDADGLEAELQRLSRALFKRRYRLSVLACVALSPSGAVYVREVARRLDIADNQVAPDFEALRAIGALLAVETADRESWHQRMEHPIWDFVTRTLEQVSSTHVGSEEDALSRYRSETSSASLVRP